jgi:succinyl-CoA synthetase alpha subunit
MISDADDTATAKRRMLSQAGVRVATTVDEIPGLLRDALRR